MRGKSAAAAETVAPVVVEALCVGDEILMGELTDTNMGHIARELWQDGFLVRFKQVVGDRLADVAAAFRLALSRADVILVTGGLGPTDDDLTREGLAEVLGQAIEVHPEALAHMARQWKRPIEAITPINRKQAHTLVGAEVLLNDWGAACGQHITHGRSHIFLMPGVPREMKGMLEHRVRPILQRLFGRPGHGFRRLVMVSGIPESRIGEILRTLAPRFPALVFGTRVNDGECAVRIDGFLQRPTAQEVRKLERTGGEALAAVREAMGFHVFGEGDRSLGEAVVEFAQAQGFTLATAESCTCGLIAARLGDVPGVSQVFDAGLVTYANAAKTALAQVPAALLEAHGAVSAPVARALARGACRTAKALRPNARPIGIGVTGVAGPEGGTVEKPVGLVYVAIASELGVATLRTQMRGDRMQIRSRAANRALFEALLEMRRVAAGPG
ncbi:MAG: CinA family nicotinamide mononucleotide deamidase-related protein [Planctomycetota bacterium]